MADKTIDLEIKLKTDAADKWREKFAKPVNIPITGSDKKFLAAMNGNAGALNDAGSSTYQELDIRHKRGELEHFKDFKDYNKTFKPYAAEVKQFTRGVMGLDSNLLKLAAGGALGAAGGIFGVVSPLTKSAVEDRNVALALGGSNIGKMKAITNAYENIMNVPNALDKVARAKTDRTSPEWVALHMLGVGDKQIAEGDVSDTLDRAIALEQNRVKKQKDPSLAITMERAYGGTNIFGEGDIRSLYSISQNERENRDKQYQDTQKRLDLTGAQQQALDELNRHLKTAGDEIETAFTRKLADSEPWILAFTDGMKGATIGVINMGDHIDDLAKYVQNNLGLTPHINPDGSTDLLGDETRSPGKDLSDAGSWLKRFGSELTKGWEELFGHPTDTWKPFFNDLEKDWKSFFDKISEGNTLGGGIGSDSVGHPGWVGGRGGGAGSLTGPGRSPTGRRGGIFTGREPNVQGTAANKDLPAEARAMLDIITANEASPPGNYNSGDADPNSFGGRYQDLNSTWNLWAKAGGFDPKDSSPANQDRVNWFGAQKDYKAATGKNLLDDLKAGNVENASSVLGSTWHGLQKSSSAQWKILYGKKLKEEAAAIAAGAAGAVVPKLPAGLVPKSNIHQPDAYKGGTSGESSEYPSPTEKSSPQSMNNMSHFQQDKKLALHINNHAGANYAVSAGMLGSGSGNYG
jgi:hypothetical protein